MLRAGPIVIFAILAGACGARGPAPQLMAEIAQAEAALRAGCYTCLKQSLAISERHLQSAQPPVGTRERAFDAALLIAIREKELGIPADAAMNVALRLLTSVPAGHSPVAQGKLLPLSRQSVFDAAQLIIGDTVSLDAEQRAVVTGRNRPPLEPDNPIRRALDRAPAGDLAANYVALTIDCEQQKLIESVDLKGLLTVYLDVPLLRFRLATCGRPVGPDVGALRAADPRWTDTLYWEGRRELASSIGRAIDLPKVLSLYALGREAFPSSVLLTLAWANANLLGEEFDGALSGFDHVLTTQPTHRDALNGRMQSLSYLLRHEDAVAAATRLLDLGTWHIADANYWRAWNRYHLKDYDAAWADVENATRGLSNSRVYMLAGLIAYSRKDLPVAVQRFDRAYELDSSACDATWMSGMVSIDQDDKRDFDTTVAWAGPSPAEWATSLGCDEHLAGALVCAAVRETFEESGVLLAGASADEVVADTTGDDWEADRVALESRELSMTDFLNRRGLVLRTDLLGAWDAWLTPAFEPKRYRTWFFAAVLPEGQRTRDVSSESSEVTWMTAADAAAAADGGDMMMLPPTFLTCLDVAQHSSVHAVLEESRSRSLEMFCPEVEPLGDGFTLSLPERLRPMVAHRFPS